MYLSPIRPDNPADLGFPPMLVYEIAMNEATPREICEAYGLSREAFEALTVNPRFIKQYERAQEELLEPGGMLRIKAMMVSEAGIKVLHGIMSDHQMLAATRMEAIKIANAMAGVGQKGQHQMDTAPSFVLNIDLRGGGEAVVRSRLGRTIEHDAQE
jgi:hypothetical protein